MKQTKKLFTLIELIVVIVVIGILAAIVIPNISSFKEEAIKTEVVANTTNLQTVTDLYALKNNGDVPTKAKPTIGNPTRIDLDELYPKYIRDKEFKHGYYWIDYTGKVWGSTIDAPKGLAYKDDTVSFEAVNNAIEYELFGYGEQGVQGAANGQSARSLENIVVDKPIKIVTKKLPLKKQSEGYLVSAVDKFGLPTAPVGKMYDGYDSIFPISQSFSLITNAHGQADWLGLFTIEEKPGDSNINYTFETSNDGVTYTPVIGGIGVAPDSQYLKVKVEMVASNGKYPTIHKMKVQFKLVGEEYVEVDLVADRTLAEGTKDQLGDIVLEDNVSEGRTEHVVTLPTETFIEDVILIGEIPVDGSIETSYQSSKDGVTWSEEVLHPEELPEGEYVKVINEIKKDTVSPTIEKIIIKTTENNPNTGPVPPVVEGPSPVEQPVLESEWESVLSFNIVEDATNVGDWISVDIVDTKPEDTRIVYEYYTSSDEINWTKYDTVEEAPNSRYLKVAVKYERLKDTTNTPKLMEMTINYKMQDGTTKSSIKYKDGVEITQSQSELLSNPMNKIATGSNHTLVVTENNELWGFGDNMYGQLGISTNIGTNTPIITPVKIMEQVSSVVSGNTHTLIITENKELWSFGWNRYGQLGRTANTMPNPTPVKVMDQVSHVSAGFEHTMVIKESGELWGFGYNYSGQLGVNLNIGTSNANPTPIKIMDEASNVVTGGFYTLVVKENGDLLSFGDNYFGQLGHNTNKNTYNSNPIPTKVAEQVSDVSAGVNHTLIVKTNGELWSFGENSYGQLGRNTSGNPDSTPQKIMDQVHSVTTGDRYSLVIKVGGELWSFGQNDFGQLGYDTVLNENITPLKVMDGVSSVSAGGQHTIVFKENGELWSFGFNNSGQLGNDKIAITSKNSTPMKITVGN